MDITTALIALGLLIFFAHIFSAWFSTTRIPSVLLLMLIGLVCGPIFNWVTPAFMGSFGNVFTTITLIVILFESGITLNFEDLKKSLIGATTLTGINFLASLTIGILAGRYLLHLDWIYSSILGAAVGGTSLAVVIPMVNQLRPGNKAGITLFLESVLGDVFCLVVALALLGGIDTGMVSIASILSSMVISLIFAVIIGVAFGVLWTILLKKTLKSLKNTMFTSFAFAFILYGIAEKLELNGGLCILAYGITMGNIGNIPMFRKLFKENEESVLNQEEKNFYSEIVFIMQTYFFVYIGISIQLNDSWHLLVGGILVVALILFRLLSVRSVGIEGIDKRDRKLIVALGPKGLVTAVIASLPMQKALAGIGDLQSAQIIQNVAYATVLISILLCSILVFIIEKQESRKTRLAESQTNDNYP